MINKLTRQLFRQNERLKRVMKKTTENQNGASLPRAKDFKLPKRLTKNQKELIESFREAMTALKKEEAKYGKKTYL